MVRERTDWGEQHKSVNGSLECYPVPPSTILKVPFPVLHHPAQNKPQKMRTRYATLLDLLVCAHYK